MADVTQILSAIERGEAQATDELLPLVYEELRRLAATQLSRESPGQTLQATALVHEAYLRLVGLNEPHWENRRHFFGAAAEAMRRILIDRARRKQRVRHGGGWERTDLEGVDIADAMPDEALLALNEALDRLGQLDALTLELVKLRFFAGLTQPQAAKLLGIAPRTADRTWAFARAWLYRELRRG